MSQIKTNSHTVQDKAEVRREKYSEVTQFRSRQWDLWLAGKNRLAPTQSPSVNLFMLLNGS